MSKVLIISNPKSGVNNYENSLNYVINEIKNFNIEITLIKTSHVGHATQLVKDTNISGYDSVCAMGGDGTLFEVLKYYLFYFILFFLRLSLIRFL